jgi:heme exporter protein C
MTMKRAFLPLTILVAAMFAYAPVMIAQAPFESTMLLVQKIFYFHVPSWFVMFSGAFICAIGSARYLFAGSRR